MSRIPSTGAPRSLARVQRWGVWFVPSAVKRVVLTVDVFATLLAIGSIAAFNETSNRQLGIFALLVIASTLFEEISARVETLRFRLNIAMHADLTSVWTFAAAVVLPLYLVLPLFLIVRFHMWFRHHKASGATPYRLVFTGATIWIGIVAAHMVVRTLSHGAVMAAGPRALGVIAAAMLVFAATNIGLVYLVMVVASGRDKTPPFWSLWRENALEFASLCIGGMAALSLIFQPWFLILVIPPMALLQRSVLTKELQIAATTDAKTGLLNAVTWQELAERELTRSRRENYSAAMLIIDMDNFKVINDSHGHLIGDAVLKAVAALLGDELREYDTIGRFGGEEFVALLPRVDALDALAISDRVLQAIRDLRIPLRGTDETLSGLSASIGVACYPQQGDQVEDLLHVADAALYRAKREGRDRVEYSYLAD